MFCSDPHSRFVTAPQLSRNELFDASWRPIPVMSPDKLIGPGQYNGAATSALGKQALSGKASTPTLSFGGEDRDKVSAEVASVHRSPLLPLL